MAQSAGRRVEKRSRYAAWLADQPESATDKALSNPAARGGGDLVNFGAGQPAVELYPLEALERAFGRAIREDGPRVLPYGATEGVLALRELVAERLAPTRGVRVGPEQVLVTSGSMQGLHLAGRVFLDHGDVILTEAPTFMGALTTWEHQQPRYLPVPIDEDGLVLEALEEALARSPRPPRFLYLMSTFQNPSGVSLSPPRRERLIELAEEYDLLIVEDDPYGEFWFEQSAAQLRPLRALPGAEERVIYLGTFSKILAPGVRLAYAVAAPDLLAKLARAKRGVDYHTDTLVQQAVVHLVRARDFDFEAHVQVARAEYRARRDAMLDALETTFGARLRWTRPAGGFFLWLDLPDGVDGAAVAQAAQAEGVSVMPGNIFYPTGGGDHSIRLGYSNATPERIQEGIRRLARALAAAAAAA